MCVGVQVFVRGGCNMTCASPVFRSGMGHVLVLKCYGVKALVPERIAGDLVMHASSN